MSTFDRYKDAYPNAKLTRTPDSVLEVRLQAHGAKLVFNGHTHEQFTDMFHQVGADPDNRDVILTGSGEAFMDAVSPEGFDFFAPRGYDKIFREGRKIQMNILDIDDCRVERLASAAFGIPPTVRHYGGDARDGDPGHAARRIRHCIQWWCQLLCPEMIGSMHGRYFVLTQQKLEASEAQSPGVVNERSCVRINCWIVHAPSPRLSQRSHRSQPNTPVFDRPSACFA
jgi:hypothetical protein